MCRNKVCFLIAIFALIHNTESADEITLIDIPFGYVS